MLATMGCYLRMNRPKKKKRKGKKTPPPKNPRVSAEVEINKVRTGRGLWVPWFYICLCQGFFLWPCTNFGSLAHSPPLCMILFTGGDATRLLWGDVTQYLYNALKMKSAKYCHLRWQQNKTKYVWCSCSSQIHFQLIFQAGIQNQSKKLCQVELYSLMGKLERELIGF